MWRPLAITPRAPKGTPAPHFVNHCSSGICDIRKRPKKKKSWTGTNPKIIATENHKYELQGAVLLPHTWSAVLEEAGRQCPLK